MARGNKVDRTSDFAGAAADYLKAQQDILDRTARLREIRLAHHEQFGKPDKPAVKSPKTPSARANSSLLNNWVIIRADKLRGGHP